MKKTWIIVLVVAVLLLGAVAVYAHPFSRAGYNNQDEWLAEHSEWLDEQVKEGNLTREEADQMQEFMEERVDDGYCFADEDDAFYGRYPGSGSGYGSGRGGMFGGGCFR